MRTLSQRVREVFGTSYTPTLSLKSRLSGREHGRKQTPNHNFWCVSGFALAENSIMLLLLHLLTFLIGRRRRRRRRFRRRRRRASASSSRVAETSLFLLRRGCSHLLWQLLHLPMQFGKEERIVRPTAVRAKLVVENALTTR